MTLRLRLLLLAGIDANEGARALLASGVAAWLRRHGFLATHRHLPAEGSLLCLLDDPSRAPISWAWDDRSLDLDGTRVTDALLDADRQGLVVECHHSSWRWAAFGRAGPTHAGVPPLREIIPGQPVPTAPLLAGRRVAGGHPDRADPAGRGVTGPRRADQGRARLACAGPVRNPLRMRVAAAVLILGAVLAAVGCGGTPQTTVDLTFFVSQTVTPSQPIDRQNYTVAFNLENADEQASTLANVQWTVSRNGIANVYSGTVPALASHQPVPVAIVDNEPPGTYIYVVTLDPNNLIHEINKTNNMATLTVTVSPLSVL